jgi:hypothetical protein
VAMSAPRALRRPRPAEPLLDPALARVDATALSVARSPNSENGQARTPQGRLSLGLPLRVVAAKRVEDFLGIAAIAGPRRCLFSAPFAVRLPVGVRGFSSKP